ncbi:polymeric immunoglobulin receptor-like isoform X2 [Thunnus albacares]|uniref:polymeric immunoglobulin receptor-like isoform X2 n=1 Tax=Thunnus albacares TaxID=8236 RepID=UPI001CF61BE9|nr:polymeric immunoglobulin receptor-like isoform X2 [Thunnus albacares]
MRKELRLRQKKRGRTDKGRRISASKANIMKSVLLLILSLMAGCEASSEVKGCEGGWVELTCKYPKADQDYQKIEVINSRGSSIQTTKKDEWDGNDKFSLYHDTRNKNLRMAIKQLEHDDFGEYNCKFYQRLKSSPETQKQEPELEVVKGGCTQFTPFTQTAYRTAKTTITCDYPKKYSYVKFVCKDNNEICEEILSTQSSVKSNGTFTLTDTNSFNMSISNVNSQHAGVYWCGVKSKEESYRASLRQIQLQVKSVTITKRSPTIGQDFKYWCVYPEGAPNNKFICKGEDPSICQPLWNTTNLDTNTGKFSMEDDTDRKNITITVRNITTDDAGTYWCGAENTDNNRSKTFFHKLEMTVAPTPPGSVNHVDLAGDVRVVIMIICIAVLLLLLLVIIVIFIYKRFSCSKPTKNGAAAQHIREDNVYEEVQERLQETGSGNAVEAIYATANFPTNPPASMYYSTIIFQSSTDKANCEALIPRPSSSACEYSIVRNSQSPIYSTVYKPSKTSEDPLLLTVNKTQQQ